MPAYKPIAVRFATKFAINSETGCWEWTGSKVAGGYGMLGGERGSANVLAHRFSYEHHKSALPTGMLVCHSCDNPGCVNPDHLFAGTHEENMRDMQRKGRACVLSGAQIDDVLSLYRGGMSQDAISQIFGVARATIGRIIAGGRESGSSAISGKYVVLSDSQRASVVAQLNDGLPVKRIAESFGVDRKTIRNIREKFIHPCRTAPG